jgi:hypothetical protein
MDTGWTHLSLNPWPGRLACPLLCVERTRELQAARGKGIRRGTHRSRECDCFGWLPGWWVTHGTCDGPRTHPQKFPRSDAAGASLRTRSSSPPVNVVTYRGAGVFRCQIWPTSVPVRLGFCLRCRRLLGARPRPPRCRRVVGNRTRDAAGAIPGITGKTLLGEHWICRVRAAPSRTARPGAHWAQRGGPPTSVVEGTPRDVALFPGPSSWGAGTHQACSKGEAPSPPGSGPAVNQQDLAPWLKDICMQTQGCVTMTPHRARSYCRPSLDGPTVEGGNVASVVAEGCLVVSGGHQHPMCVQAESFSTEGAWAKVALRLGQEIPGSHPAQGAPRRVRVIWLLRTRPPLAGGRASVRCVCDRRSTMRKGVKGQSCIAAGPWQDLGPSHVETKETRLWWLWPWAHVEQ